MRSICLWIMGVLMLLVAGAASAGAQDRPDSRPVATAGDVRGVQEPTLQQHNPRYRLCLGDTVEIKFRFTPEFDQSVIVQPDGFISLRDISDLHVAGKTVPEVTEILLKRYSRILHDPLLTIVLKDFEKPYFIANGEVGRPGKYDLRGDTTVLEAVGVAGGFNERSKHSQVLLFRRVSGQWTPVKILDIKAMLSSGNLSEDPRLHPGDMIYVPKNTASKAQPWLNIFWPSWGLRYPY
jgi:polysaccharide export outer membrane protein